MDGGSGENIAAYDRLAWFYERYWAKEYHGPAFSIFDRLALGETPAGARVLDLCCGTGHLTRLLSQRGFRVTGIDCSKGMLAEARKKMPETEFVAADAREFRLAPVFLAAVCGFEGMSHILEEDGLAAAFRNTYCALAPGGLFIFDLNTEAAYSGPWSKSSALVEKDHLFIIRGHFDRASAIASTEITTMRLIRGEGWKREDICIRQRCYDPEAAGRTLLESGFQDIEYRDAQALGMTGDLAIGRVFFRGRKR